MFSSTFKSPVRPPRHYPKLSRLILAGILWSSLGLVGCSSSEKAPQNTAAPPASEGAAADFQQNIAQKSVIAEGESLPVNPVDVTRTTPQLIKTADLTLRVEAVEVALDEVSKITRVQQGDILNLQDQRPLTLSDRHIATITVRVPQAQLETTMGQLRKLGKVQYQAIQAQDVSNQIVDSSARLRNLRKSETLVLEIMERSGSIKDVLAVSQKLSEIREQIEKIDAQLQSLKSQVAFSTLRLRLEATTVSLPQKDGLGPRLEETWATSTHAMGEFMTVMMEFGIWAMVFSPVLIVLGLGGFFLQRRVCQKRLASTIASSKQEPPPLGALGRETPRQEPEETINDEGT